MRVVRGLLVVVLVAFVAWIAGATWLRMRAPEAHHAAAVDVLQVPAKRIPSHRNLADAMRLLGHDVPVDRRDEVLAAVKAQDAQDVRRFEAGRPDPFDIRPDPLDAYPAWPSIPDSSALCTPVGEDCLERVRADPAAAAALLQAHATELRATLALADNAGFRLDRTPSVLVIPPATGGRRRGLVATHIAWRFVSGDVDGALAATCRDLAGWRRIAADSDHIVPTLVATAYAEHDARWLARMVAELPASHALPGECTVALAPSTDAELDICQAMRLDFAETRTLVLDELPDAAAWSDVAYHKVASRVRVAQLVAPAFARYCDGTTLADARADRKTTPLPRDWTPCPTWQVALDPVDCDLADVIVAGSRRHDAHLDRRTDLAATLALLRTALWLRDTDADPRPRAQRLAERPASLGLRREAVLSDDGLALVMLRLDRSHEADVRLPLPPAH
jgi:hypothetical protein